MSTTRPVNSAHEVPRRRFLQAGAATGVALLASEAVPRLQAPAQAQTAEAPNDIFLHGVASGDPLADRVIIWTRVSGMPATPGEVPVSWSMAVDEAMTKVVATGATSARSGQDWTVHVDVSGLKPATSYWYAFEVNGVRSPTGRTRTARAPDDPGEIRLGVVSCAAWPGGFFTAYRLLARRDVDLVVHLGDYIYEFYREVHRAHDKPAPAVTLDDYRGRYRQYRSDPDLQALHRRHPIAAVWDDHEVAGNAWAGGASGHQPSTQGPWAQRRAAAMQAYFEWLPVRRPDPDRPARIWRSLALGGAAELVLIDTRHDGRDKQVDARTPDPRQVLDDPGRSMISVEQREWLAERLTGSEATWRLVVNQVLFSPFGLELPGPLAAFGSRFGILADGVAINPDSWDGYGGERSRVLAILAEQTARNTVFLTGDVHSSWAFEVPGKAGANNPAAVELVVPAISSTPFGRLLGGSNGVIADYLGQGNLINQLVTSAIESQLEYLRWSEVGSNGYVVASITPERVWAEWWHVKGVGPDDKSEHRGAAWQINAGTSRLVAAKAADAPGPRDKTPTETGAEESDQRDTTAPSPVTFGLVGVAVAAAAGAAVTIRRRRPDDPVGQDPPPSF
ncbi:MAG: alkaline phosphatase D family protein [Actinobacteria bacterium]|nr:alkaline phosphatase D family protein [Actinomycetota bacterium]